MAVTAGLLARGEPSPPDVGWIAYVVPARCRSLFANDRQLAHAVGWAANDGQLISETSRYSSSRRLLETIRCARLRDDRRPPGRYNPIAYGTLGRSSGCRRSRGRASNRR